METLVFSLLCSNFSTVRKECVHVYIHYWSIVSASESRKMEEGRIHSFSFSQHDIDIDKTTIEALLTTTENSRQSANSGWRWTSWMTKRMESVWRKARRKEAIWRRDRGGRTFLTHQRHPFMSLPCQLLLLSSDYAFDDHFLHRFPFFSCMWVKEKRKEWTSP